MRSFRLLCANLIVCVTLGALAVGAWGQPAATTWVQTFQAHTQPNTDLHHVARTRTRQRSSAEAFIRKVRFHKHPTHTRVVVELRGALNVKEVNDASGNRVVLQLANTRLGKRAFRTTLRKTFPPFVKIARKWNQPTTVTIDMNAVAKYKVLKLNKPTRLVIDLYPRPAAKMAPAQRAPTQTAAQTPSVAPVKATPAPSKIPAAAKAPSTQAKTQSAKTQKPEAPVNKRPAQTKTQRAPSPPPAAPSGPFRIVLDPGHGGKDPGALGRKGTREKDIVLKVAQRLKTLLTKRLNAKVLMTRTKDVFVELEDRAAFANDKKADLFVSIHVNSHPKRYVKGLEVYHFGEASDRRAMEVAARENGTPLNKNAPAWQFILADKLTDKKIDDSQNFAWTARKALVGKLRKHYKVKDHGVKTAPFFVLRMTTMPGILAEIAFVSNPTEENLLTSKTYQQRVAEGIFEGIKAYVTPLRTAANQ